MQFPDLKLYPSDADIANIELQNSAFGFVQSILALDQYGLWNVFSAVLGAQPHPNPDYRELIQSNMREMAQGYVLLFYHSIWDHFFPRELSALVLGEWCTPDEALRFRAMKHVRHSIAHSFDGKRADQNRKHFNEVMAGSNPFRGIEFTEDTIDLSGCQIATECRDFFRELAPNLQARITNDRQP